MVTKIEKLRVEYGNASLNEQDIHFDPLKQFSRWLNEAIKAKLYEPNAMILSTTTLTHRPSSRTVLLKGVDKKGFIFFTHTASRKAAQLDQNARGALCFWWREIFRQVLVEGSVQPLLRKECAGYFAKRPRGAQLASWISDQSEPLASRALLEKKYAALKNKCANKVIPCPPHFGGYRIIADRIEFWQGRQNRLHDRILYVRTNGKWLITPLFP